MKSLSGGREVPVRRLFGERMREPMKEEILRMLKETGDYVSGQELSQRLHVSRSAVWKHIKALKEEGYEIDSVTNRGYLLKNIPELWDKQQIEENLKTLRLGRELLLLHKVDSTNEELKRRARSGAVHGLVCVAEKQVAGKGRLGRVWSSPAGVGIWMSVLLRPDISPFEVSGITLAAGLAVCRAVQKLTGCNAKIKWPNDVVIGRKKVCGILTEMSAESDRVDFTVVGIGINVNTDSFPEEIACKATSLKIETGKHLSRTALLCEVLLQLEIYTDEFLLNTCGSITDEYKENCVTIGRKVSAVRGGVQVMGEAVDVTLSGALVIREKNGKLTEINSGEVVVQGIY